MASTDLPRMQHQPRTRAPAERGRKIAAQAAEKVAPRGKPQMMRQYELVERVRKYNPNTNEELLNRAYVYAMKAHGTQLRASGDPYFSHPLEVAAILTDLKLDDATIVAALLHDTIEDTEATRAEIDQLFGKDIGRLVEGLTKHRRGRARAPGQTGRPSAQHAHARSHAAGGAPAQRGRDDRHLRPAGGPHRHV
jgi:(p)ppGpp synthase/HD superfamily hydrolase